LIRNKHERSKGAFKNSTSSLATAFLIDRYGHLDYIELEWRSYEKYCYIDRSKGKIFRDY
jgi:hypothetical protein